MTKCRAHTFGVFMVSVVAGCAPAVPPHRATGEPVPLRPLDVALAHGTSMEDATRAQLKRLVATYDLAPWLITRQVVIDEQAIPHSFPVLTLHARHLGDDDFLLSTFVHEQAHWFLSAREAETTRAVGELKHLLPGLPTGHPEGAESEQSSYVHLVVIFLELEGATRALGTLRAKRVFDFWETDHYRALYRTVREHHDVVARVVRQNGLSFGP